MNGTTELILDIKLLLVNGNSGVRVVLALQISNKTMDFLKSLSKPFY